MEKNVVTNSKAIHYDLTFMESYIALNWCTILTRLLWFIIRTCTDGTVRV